MKTIAVIGATGKLGKALMAYQDTIECPIRFDQADLFEEWFDQNKNVDTVWHVARACRPTGVRRDFGTFMLEQNAINKLLDTRAKDCNFVYASTKVVYGITGQEITPLPAHHVAEYFVNNNTGIVNCPSWKNNSIIKTKGLTKEHLIYAMTKLACERHVIEKCKNYRIIRVWDII
jgi:nucleoside-diphosphate-sugar epimerase